MGNSQKVSKTNKYPTLDPTPQKIHAVVFNQTLHGTSSISMFPTFEKKQYSSFQIIGSTNVQWKVAVFFRKKIYNKLCTAVLNMFTQLSICVPHTKFISIHPPGRSRQLHSKPLCEKAFENADINRLIHNYSEILRPTPKFDQLIVHKAYSRVKCSLYQTKPSGQIVSYPSLWRKLDQQIVNTVIDVIGRNFSA